ncbi:MAG: hydrogenase maturation protease [Pontibacterium sp.]
MSRWRIIGLGSPQADDRFGWQVIEQLQQEDLPESVELLALDRPGVSLLHYLQGADQILLVDACDTGQKPGSLIRLSGDELLDAVAEPVFSSHHLGIVDTLLLGRACRLNLPPITLMLAQLGTLAPMQPLTADLFRAVEQSKQQILLLLQS